MDSQSFTLHSTNSCELLFHIIERCSSLVVPHYLFIHKSKTRTRWIPLAMSDPRKFGMRPPNNSSEINFRHYLFSPRPGQELYCCSGYAMSIQQVISIIILFIHKAYIIWDEIILSWPEIITVSGARAFLLGVLWMDRITVVKYEINKSVKGFPIRDIGLCLQSERKITLN